MMNKWIRFLFFLFYLCLYDLNVVKNTDISLYKNVTDEHFEYKMIQSSSFFSISYKVYAV